MHVSARKSKAMIKYKKRSEALGYTISRERLRKHVPDPEDAVQGMHYIDPFHPAHFGFSTQMDVYKWILRLYYERGVTTDPGCKHDDHHMRLFVENAHAYNVNRRDTRCHVCARVFNHEIHEKDAVVSYMYYSFANPHSAPEIRHITVTSMLEFGGDVVLSVKVGERFSAYPVPDRGFLWPAISEVLQRHMAIDRRQAFLIADTCHHCVTELQAHVATLKPPEWQACKPHVLRVLRVPELTTVIAQYAFTREVVSCARCWGMPVKVDLINGFRPDMHSF